MTVKRKAKQLNRKQFNIFLTVAKCGSFSKAEKDLFLSRQAIMKQIDHLQKESDLKLFERSPSGLVLTVQGRMLADGLAPLMERMDKLFEKCRSVAEKDKRLIIELPVHPSSLLTPIISRFNSVHPQITLRIERASSDGRLQRIHEGRIDLAQYAFHPHDDLEGLEFTPLIERPYYCLISPQHPLADHERIIPSQLEGNELYIYSFRVRKELVAFLQQIEPSLCFNAISGDEIQAIMNICYSGGIYITPAPFATRMDYVKAIPLDISLKQQIGILTRSTKSIADHLFLEYAHSFFQNEYDSTH